MLLCMTPMQVRASLIAGQPPAVAPRELGGKGPTSRAHGHVTMLPKLGPESAIFR